MCMSPRRTQKEYIVAYGFLVHWGSGTAKSLRASMQHEAKPNPDPVMQHIGASWHAMAVSLQEPIRHSTSRIPSGHAAQPQPKSMAVKGFLLQESLNYILKPFAVQSLTQTQPGRVAQGGFLPSNTQPPSLELQGSCHLALCHLKWSSPSSSSH